MSEEMPKFNITIGTDWILDAPPERPGKIDDSDWLQGPEPEAESRLLTAQETERMVERLFRTVKSKGAEQE